MKQFKLTYPVNLKSSGGFCTTPLEIIIGYSHEQGAIPRRFTVDELFDDVTRVLK